MSTNKTMVLERWTGVDDDITLGKPYKLRDMHKRDVDIYFRDNVGDNRPAELGVWVRLWDEPLISIDYRSQQGSLIWNTDGKEYSLKSGGNCCKVLKSWSNTDVMVYLATITGNWSQVANYIRIEDITDMDNLYVAGKEHECLGDYCEVC